MYQFRREQVAEKYNVKEVLYGLRQVYDSLRWESELSYELKAIKRAMAIIRKKMPKMPRDGHCPICGHEVDNFFCPECGQAIYYNHGRRPIDEFRRDTEWRHHDADYYYVVQRRQIDEYVRIFGLEWVLERLASAEVIAQPMDEREIKELALESEGEGDEEWNEE